jgi:hypothetical protein
MPFTEAVMALPAVAPALPAAALTGVLRTTVPVDAVALVVADRVPVVLAAEADAVAGVRDFLGPAVFAALALLDVARTVRAAVVPRDDVVALAGVVAADMAFAASVSDLTADSIALVAVLTAWSAVVIVLADEVALEAAVLSFAAAVVAFVAAAETARGVAAVLGTAVVRAVVVRLAGARAVVVRAAVVAVPEACVVVARAFVGLAAARFAAVCPAALALAVLAFASLVPVLPGFAVVGRVFARFLVLVGTDLPPRS